MEEEGEEIEGEVSYSVSGDLQIILNRYFEFLEVQKGKERSRCGRGRWS